MVTQITVKFWDGEAAELRKWNASYSDHEVAVGVAPVQIYLETYLETCLIIARGGKKSHLKLKL